jgi:hypothetical protein
MTLDELASGARPVALALIGGDKLLARGVQQRLAEIGVLDPPVDGEFGPASLWALGQFLRKAGMAGKTQIDRDAARLLLGAQAEALFPLAPADTFAGRVVRALQQAGYWLSRHPDCVNIVYLEGVDPDGRANDDAPNQFNDLRLVLRVNRAGNPDIVDAWEGTTEPGRYYTLVSRLDPNGAARIAFGQYKAWSVGTHMGGRPSAHEALVQTRAIKVHRDLNQDFQRTGDRVFEGLFGVNQHWGFDLPKSDIGRASAGCLVGRTRAGHRAFMAIIKADPRYVANNSYRFMTTVLPAGALK